MEYREYQLAAEKHLKACKATLSILATENFNQILSNEERKFLLMDIYYLSGYIFESSVNYALFKLTFRRTTPRTADTFDVKQFAINDSNCSFAYKNDHIHRIYYRYVIAGHNFWHNIDLLELLAPSPEIRYFKRDLSVSSRNLLDNSVNGWKPEKRYLIENPPLSFEQVNELLVYAEKLYKETLKIR